MTAKKHVKMMSTNVYISPEQLQELVASITTAAMQAVSAMAARGTTMNDGSGSRKSFSDLTITFSGARDTAQVEEFLAAASIFKKVHKINDTDAIMCLPLILKGEASTWWQSVKSGIETWFEFETRLRHAFAPEKPAYLIYQELFAKSQPADILTEVYVAKNRALLAQLPTPAHTEQQQLDMIYGQLHVNIRKRVPREKVQTFDELLTAARGAEQLAREKAVAKEFLKDDISKLEEITTTDDATIEAPSPSQPTFSCYGCGSPEVIGSKCMTCTTYKEAKDKEAKKDFCALNISTDAQPRPTIGIGIVDIVGNACLDTCAKPRVTLPGCTSEHIGLSAIPLEIAAMATNDPKKRGRHKKNH